jgi:hypothetical protein
MRDPSLNLPQGGEIDNHLRINQPHSQAPPERRGSGEGEGAESNAPPLCAQLD